MKPAILFLCLVFLLSVVSGCGTSSDPQPQGTSSVVSSSPVSSEAGTTVSQPDEATPEESSQISREEVESVKIQITAEDTAFTAIPENNSSAEAFVALLEEGPITVSMSDYAGMEKVGPLGTDLPRNDRHISVGAGDVILYQGNQITIYYGTNSWSFTKLAVIEGATKKGLLEVLGSGDVEVTFSIAE